MVKKAYSIETKLACIEIKKDGKSHQVIMETLGIKNVSQVRTWWKWYQNDALYRLYQPVGKQYSYGKGIEQLSEVEELRLQVKLLKKYRIMKTKGWLCRTRPKKSPKLGQPYHVTENKLNRELKATKPMEKLVTDITYLYFEKCKLYLSSTMDLYNRKLSLIPFQTGKILTLLDTLDQLDYLQGAMLHSEQGSVYTSKAY